MKVYLTEKSEYFFTYNRNQKKEKFQSNQSIQNVPKVNCKDLCLKCKHLILPKIEPRDS